jgi:nicotinate-nucleotide pyrophosphorylase (carboxylating)
MSLNVDPLLRSALQEDITSEDVSTNSVMPAGRRGHADLICKQDGVICGLQVFARVFRLLDPETSVIFHVMEGDDVSRGQLLAEVTGDIRVILSGERTALNYLQRMSGVATTTARYAKCLEGLKTRVLDTRKTTPGMRLLEKDAVKIGGGCNHRIGLFDMILLKDNHVDFAGGIVPAIENAHRWCKENGKDLKIEIEVRNFDELQQVLDHGGVDRVMLDNFSVENTRKAVEIINGRVETESSGGITIDTLRAYGECGVDYISVGALTHSIKSLDMSFKAC